MIKTNELSMLVTLKGILGILLILASFGGISRQVFAQAEIPAIQGQLAYIGADGNLYVHRSDLEEDFKVTQNGGSTTRYLAPRWSPDGLRLAYCEIPPDTNGLGRLNMLQIGEWQPIVLDDRVYCVDRIGGSFSWSPDGTEILYGRIQGATENEQGGIWKVNFIDGNKSLVIPLHNTRPLALPDWAPSGNYVRFYEVISAEGLGVLSTWADESGTIYSWIENGGEVFPGYSTWSPDGAYLLYDEVTYLGFPGASIYRALANGSEITRIYQDPALAAQRPLWSTDGSIIAFQLSRPGRIGSSEVRLVLMNSDGSNLREIAQGSESLIPLDWSPNGKQLFFADYDGQRIIQYIYDVEQQVSFEFGSAGAWSVAWSVEPAWPEDTSSKAIQVLEGIDHTHAWLLYLSTEYQLLLKSVTNSALLELSKPMAIPRFWASPSGKRILTPRLLIRLDFVEGEQLLVAQHGLTASPIEDRVAWSPDEQQVAYQDRSGNIWLVNEDGTGLTIPGAISLPSWSPNSAWLAYCDGENRLWYVGPGKAPRVASSDVSCEHLYWSPGASVLLAFQQDKPDTTQHTVVILDVESGKSSEYESIRLFLGWAPADNWFAAEYENSDGSYSLVFGNSLDGRTVMVERTREAAFEQYSWGHSLSPLLFGPYRFDVEQLTVGRQADRILAQDQDGQRIISVRADRSLANLSCDDLVVGLSQPLVTINAEKFESQVRASLSPNGEWAAYYTSDNGWPLNLLTRCDLARQLILPAQELPRSGQFSPDGDWFLQSLPDSSTIGRYYLYELTIDQPAVITTLQNSDAVWIVSNENVPIERFEISGSVQDDNNKPLQDVAVVLNHHTTAYTNKDGEFHLQGLPVGEYGLSLEKDTYSFSPADVQLHLPGSPGEVQFTASQEVLVEEQAAPPTSAAPVPPAESRVESFPVGEFLWANAVWFGETYGWYLILGVPGILGLLYIFRRLHGKTATLQAETGSKTIPAAEGSKQTGLSAEQSEAWVDEAVRSIRAGDITGAQHKLRVVLDHFPENGRAWIWAGVAAARMKQLKQAEYCFRQAYRLDHPKARQALEWLGVNPDE